MFTLKTTTTGAALIIGAAALTSCGAAPAHAPVLEMAAVQNPPAAWWGELPPCDEEDGTRGGQFGCYWDADSRGNAGGTSFYTTANGTTVTVPAEW